MNSWKHGAWKRFLLLLIALSWTHGRCHLPKDKQHYVPVSYFSNSKLTNLSPLELERKENWRSVLLWRYTPYFHLIWSFHYLGVGTCTRDQRTRATRERTPKQDGLIVRGGSMQLGECTSQIMASNLGSIAPAYRCHVQLPRHLHHGCVSGV
jgi:hypothetical protein